MRDDPITHCLQAMGAIVSSISPYSEGAPVLLV
jgi:hypothetical protein